MLTPSRLWITALLVGFTGLFAATPAMAGPSDSLTPQLGPPTAQDPTAATAPADNDDAPVTVTTAWSATGAKPGGKIALAVVMDIRKGWHIRDASSDIVATTVQVAAAPPTLVFEKPIFPKTTAMRDVGDGKPVPLHEGKVIVFVPVTLTAAAAPGEAAIKLKIGWQSCNDKICLPPTDITKEIKLTIVGAAGKVEPANAELFKNYSTAAAAAPTGQRLNIPFFGLDFTIDPTSLFALLGIAAIGGALLNFTPCVLPLIPIKVLSLSRAAGNRSRAILLALTMSAGVVAFWLGMGIAITLSTAAIARGETGGITATNQLFQQPWFTIGVGVVIGVMAIGMCGLFAIQLPQAVYMINPKQESLTGSFLFGIMTAVLSTPCTAPFMGAAAAWAATREPFVTLSTFAAIGVGMATPYLLLSAFPALVNKMPRTGPASELIKQVMGLLMLAAAVYFIGTGLSGKLNTPPDPPSRMYWWAVALFVAAAGVWLARQTIRITPSHVRRIVFVALGVFFIAAAAHIGFRFTERGPIKWVYYTPQRLTEAKADRKVVVLEFTAEWCLNCKALEEAVLSNPGVVELLNSPGVAPIKVDITGNNETGNAKLAEVGSRTIPLLIVYDLSGKELFRSDAYTVGQLIDALHRAKTGSAQAKAG